MSTIREATDSKPLPRPAERPEADIVLYDAHCRMCTSQIRRLAGWDSKGRLAYLPLDDTEVARRWPELEHEALMREMHVIDPAGRVRGGADAFRYLSRRLPRLYWLAPILNFPGSLGLWRWGYRQVAKRRYRFGKVSCDSGTCQLHG
jgi:predicted DCC family thiol-disulfide oxidoreductase YuxK